MSKLMGRLSNSKGQSMLEYILIVIFVIVIGIAAWRMFGKRISAMVRQSSDYVSNQVKDATQGQVDVTKINK